MAAVANFEFIALAPNERRALEIELPDVLQVGDWREAAAGRARRFAAAGPGSAAAAEADRGRRPSPEDADPRRSGRGSRPDVSYVPAG